MSDANPPLENERGALPTVARPRAGPSPAVFGLVLAVVALILFATLNAHRQSLSAPATGITYPTQSLGAPSQTLPPLAIPPVRPEPSGVAYEQVRPTTAPPPTYTPSPPPRSSPSTYEQTRLVAPQGVTMPESAPRLRTGVGGSALVMDSPGAGGSAPMSTGLVGSTAGAGDAAGIAADGSAARARAGRIADTSMTVAQGTVLSAVLETSLNSTGAGFARALVQRNIASFDGSRILIPRGSRLIGTYGADTQAGQNRLLIRWTRLIRPDGTTIALDSPATDPLGAPGVKADVNNHFFARFSGAILQSALNLGVNLAARSANSPVIVALPGSLQQPITPPTQSNSIEPTLKVRAGTSVSVFVARDLDFSDAEPRSAELK